MIKLNVTERLVLTGIIPEKGNFRTMNTVDKLKKVLHLSEEEIEEYELKQNGENLVWNKKGSERKEIEITELGFELLMESFEKLDKEENLNIFQFPVYKYFKEFVEEKEKKEVDEKTEV